MNYDYSFYNNIFDTTAFSVCVYNDKGIILYCNNHFQQSYLNNSQGLKGISSSEILDPEYQSINFINQVLTTDKTISRHQKIGINQLFIVTVFPLSDKDGNRVFLETIFSKLAKDFLPYANSSTPISSESIMIKDKSMDTILETISRISHFDSTILITGESGTGKSMIAKHIHDNSNRAEEAFVVIDCATIPENLIESELFGYVSGAFTGAQNSGKTGMVELANKGTLFLDEIGLLPFNLQSKFLQLIQEKTYTPIGSLKSKTVDIRIISATNVDLKELIADNKFRLDLFYRLRVIELHMPPLRERRDAIEPLILHFIDSLNIKYNMNKSISKDAIDILKKSTWAGNTRELQYLIERLFVTSPQNLISSRDLPPLAYENKDSSIDFTKGDISFDKEVGDFEKKLLEDAFNLHKSSHKVGKALGITQTRASRLLRKYQIK